MSWGDALVIFFFAVVFAAAAGIFRRHGLSAHQRVAMSLVAVGLLVYSLLRQAPRWNDVGIWALLIIAAVVIYSGVKTVNRKPPDE